MRNKRLLTLSAAALLAALPLSVPMVAGAAAGSEGKAVGQKQFRNNAYIVQLAEDPVVAYRGGIKGLAATRPAKGQKIDPNSPAVIRYMAFLASRQDAALNAVGGGKKLYNYGYVFNGFAADLTAAQAQKLAQLPGVIAVTKDEIRKMDTASTPSFLGLAGAPELLGSHGRQWQCHQGRQTGLPADPGLARQVHAGRSLSRE
jgi:hypothetical protein